VANYVIANTVGNGPLSGKVAHVIVGDRIWEPSRGWSFYGGIYHTHVHVDTNEGRPCHP
jgi:hypothetical protein